MAWPNPRKEIVRVCHQGRRNLLSLADLFKFGTAKAVSSNELPDIFPLSLTQATFIESDILSTYLKILTDVIERTHGLKEEFKPLLWDNCLQNEANEGLVTLLANAMTKKTELFLVYVPSVKVLRKATHEEQEKIRADYKKSGESKVGIFVSFKKYRRTEMLEIYSAFEYCVLSGLNKTLNISKAVQLKINKLRESVAVADAQVAVDQAKSIANALKNGNDVMLDKEDEIATATPDTSSTEKAITFLDAKRAFILGLPIAYVTGQQTGGIGSSGENDMRAVERGLIQYFVSIIQPVLKALWGAETEFKSQDFRQMTTALEVLKTFDLVSDENMPKEMKLEILARVFDVDLAEMKKQIEVETKERDKEEEENPPVDNIDPNVNPANKKSFNPKVRVNQ